MGCLTHLMLQDGNVASVSRGCRRWFSPLPKRVASFICVPLHWVRCVSVPYLNFTDCHMLTLLTTPPSFVFPLWLCLLATPWSCWQRQDTSPASRKIKQTPTTSDKRKTHPPITARVHHSEPRLRGCVNKPKGKEKIHQNLFSVIVFSESLWLLPSHSCLARGYPTAARWLRNLKHFFLWAGRASLRRKGGAGVREEMFPASCCGTTGAKRTELVTAWGKGCFFFLI